MVAVTLRYNTYTAAASHDIVSLTHQVIHWNSPLKTNVVLKHVQYFRQFYNIFTEMDGSHLR